MAAFTANAVDMRPPVITIHPRSKDIFSQFSLDDKLQKQYAQGIEALKEEARSMLMAAKSAKVMILIDTLERLGLGYHFEKEIEEKLEAIYKKEDGDDYDLFTTALRFRLLRQHQRRVPCSVFDKFMNKEGKFEEEPLISDVEGLLSLYDAAYLQIHGEHILQEALIFTTHHLTRIEPQLDDHSPLKLKLNRALEFPFYREIPIIYAHFYISVYERDDSRDEVLLKMAKLSYNFLQNLYKKELSQLSRWWNKLELIPNLPYIRDSVAGAYLWAVALYFEPQYSDVRMAIAKLIQIAAAVDDTYDNYATIREAQLLTEALERLNVHEIDTLPDYMKIVYRFVMSWSEDFERDATIKEQMLATPYFKAEMKKLGRAYNQELKWVMERQLPSFEEYMKNSEITSGVYIMFTVISPYLNSATQKNIDWLLSQPRLASSTAIVMRCCNDLGSNQRESKGGEVMTSLDCYMKQHGASKQETISKFKLIIEDEWKNLNEEWAATTCLPKVMVEIFRNYARIAGFCYKNNGDAYTSPKIVQQCFDALFVNPLRI
uniref:Gamma-curcumene synthase n=1 Tax=Pogostemon cablin TaxID=28511 RepID=TPSCS_POGCB|nr:RecName: Full=Gamma-curcumene synthase; AltName: Full=PatTpsA [Pogostemon cablin]AAS86319.1 gamma-curcumene synthase [Pogostemon cablin]